VLVGRPTVWGLTVAGASGVTWVLETLWAELAMAMALLGTPTIDQVTADCLWSPPA
jgi:isopentenyl diphosphate isomerase/L-lactate dehydrogenase-like FMN-dependent dehydrogenase